MKGWILVVACGAVLVSGCQAPGVKQSIPIEVKPRPKPQQPAKSASAGRATMLGHLLGQAERALAKNRLTQPAYDNAYDKFSAALLLAPKNAQAQNGLNTVQMQLVGIAREHLAQGHLSKADAQYQKVLGLFPNAPLVGELSDNIRAAKAAIQSRLAKARRTAHSDPNRYLIPVKHIRSEADDAKQWFTKMAQAIKASDSSIFIHARSDSEGRWVYKALRSSVDNYLIRGDIRIGDPPAIELLEPLP